jgi:hypothetical protein
MGELSGPFLGSDVSATPLSLLMHPETNARDSRNEAARAVRVRGLGMLCSWSKSEARLWAATVIAHPVVLSAAKDLHLHRATARAGPSPAAQDDNFYRGIGREATSDSRETLIIHIAP